METAGLIESFQEFKEFKDIDRETLMKILEDVFRNMIQKKYGSDDNYDFIINIDKGDLEVWRNRTIVEKGEVAFLLVPKKMLLDFQFHRLVELGLKIV